MDARGADDADLVLDQGQDDVQVVDHQVQDHVDVQRAGRERAQALDLDELGLGDHGLDRLDGRIEALQVPDLEDQPVLGLGLGHELLGLRHRLGDGLLDQDVLAAPQQVQGDGEMDEVGVATMPASISSSISS